MSFTTFPSTSPHYEMEPSSLSDTQEKVLILLSILGCSLSVLGSSTIVYKTLNKGFQRGPYDRLMLGLSICDIVSSLNLALSPFMLPSATSQRVWATGNDATCSMNGWFYQFSFSATLYNGMLSYYYLLTVRFGVKRAIFAARYEIWMHAAIWIWSLATASFGAGIGLFNELALGFGCWASDYPENCEIIDIDTCTSHYYGWAIGAVPTILVFLSLFVNNVVIFFYVRRILAPRRELRDERAMRQATQINEVATQGYLYVGTFLLAFVPAVTVRVLESLNYTAQDEARIFGFLVLTAFFQPLQGFFNAIVFNKPNYLRIRTAYPELPWYQAVRDAFFLSDIPRLTITAAVDQSGTRGSRQQPGVSKAADAPKVVSRRDEEEDDIDLGQGKRLNTATTLGRRFGNLHFGAPRSKSRSDEENGSVQLAEDDAVLRKPCDGGDNEADTPQGRSSIRNSASTAATMKMSNQGIAPVGSTNTTPHQPQTPSFPFSPGPNNNIPSSFEFVAQDEYNLPLSNNEITDPVFDPSEGAMTAITHQEDSMSGYDEVSEAPSLSFRSSRIAMDGSIESNSR